MQRLILALAGVSLALGFGLLACGGGGREAPQVAGGSDVAAGAVEAGPEPAAEGPDEPAAIETPQPAAESASVAEPRSSLRLPETLRVGLATDLDLVEIGCCASVMEHDGQDLAAHDPIRVRPSPGGGRPGVYRLQVAALSDEGQAAEMVRELERRFGEPSESVFDAGVGLYRVRIGRYPDRPTAEAARGKLRTAGLGESWIVSEAGSLGDPGLEVTVGGETRRLAGRWVGFRAAEGGAIRVQGRRYRERILVYLNDRAQLNLINELSLENYIRGVVPREMGPNIYGEIEALKAQAVAARTYTVRNLEEFGGEGYDICATPRCQVYGGLDDEHPMSDEAVAATAGQVLVYGDDLVDALYSATCGGHTENVEIIFPLKHYDYLRGVPCVEAGVDQVGRAAAGDPFPLGLTDRLFPATGTSAADRLSNRLIALAREAGLAVPDDRLRSLDRREVQRFLASVFDLALDARLFTSPHDIPYLIENPPAGWSQADLRLAAYLVKSGLLSGRLDRPLAPVERERMIFQLALFLQVLEEREVRYQARNGESLQVREGVRQESLRLAPGVSTFRRESGETVAGPLSLLPGDPLLLYLRSDELAAVVHEIDMDGVGLRPLQPSQLLDALSQ